MDPRSKGARIGRLRKMIAAIPKHLSQAPLMIASKRQTPASLAKIFQEELDAILAIDLADAAKKKAVVDERAVKKRNRVIHAAFKTYVLAAFRDAVVLADFAYKPLKARKTKLATKAEAIEKSRATRKARHTLGKKQKKKI